DEDDLALALVGLIAQERELEPARAAPGGPLVHDDRLAALLLDLLLERVRATGEEGRGRRPAAVRAAPREGRQGKHKHGQATHAAKDGRALCDPISNHGVLQ